MKPVRDTHVYVRRRKPGGGSSNDREAIVQRAPIRASSYSAGERLMIVEIMVFYLIDREIVHCRDITHLVNAYLKLQKCEDLLVIGPNVPRAGTSSARIRLIDLYERLLELRLIGAADPVNSESVRRTELTVTPKGRRHIKKQARRLQACAQKLVFTGLLDKLVRAVG